MQTPPPDLQTIREPSTMMILGILGSLVTIGAFVGGIIFRMGHQSARIEALEQWRQSIRIDMHEISDKLEAVGKELGRLSTLIEERTQRFRGNTHDDQRNH